MKKCFLVLLCFLCAIQSAAAISASSAILMEASSGQVLFEKDADARRGIASTTKIMTALVVLSCADLDEIVTVLPSCTGIEGSSMYLQPGEELSVRDLLYGLMLQSGNDCAAVLAHHVAGSSEQFVSLMNEAARRMSLNNTHFTNPSGLPDEAHYSSAYDMARLVAYAMKVPEFQKIVSTVNHKVGAHYLHNHNRLLQLYPGVDGVKTGFTKAAGRCLASSAVRDGVRLIAITLNAPNDWNDHMSLYDMGFSQVSRVLCREKGAIIGTLPVVGSVTTRIPVVLSKNLEAVIPKTAADSVETVYHVPRFLYAPVQVGTRVGTALMLQDGNIVSEVPILAAKTVDSTNPKGFRGLISRIFS